MDREYEAEHELEDVDNGHDQQQEGEELEASHDEQLPEEGEVLDEEQQPVEPVAEKPKKKANIGERLSQVQREKYQALDELRTMREENERLRSLNDASTQTALNHYDQAVQQRFQAAKDQKIKALESGDILAQTDADIALSMATAEYQNLNNMKAQQEVYQQPHHQQQQQSKPPTYEHEVYDWATQNDWFVPASENYDERMANEVHAYCNAFDNNLRRAGQSHMINSRDYLDLVDQHIAAIRNNGNPSSRGRDLQMKSGRGTVAPVRGSQGSHASSGRTQAPKLSIDESDMDRRLGVTEEAYLKQRQDDERNNGHRRIRR